MSAEANLLLKKATPPAGPVEVRYSLPELLADVQAERLAPAYANEQLDQVEIGKLFQKNRLARAQRNKK